MVCTLLIFSSCDKNVHNDEQGVVVVLEMPSSDKAEGVDIQVFNNNAVLSYIYSFATIEDVNSTLLPLPAGEYTLVTTIGTKEHFTTTGQIGTTTLSNFLFIMKDPDSSPNHAHYGVTTVTSVKETNTQATIKANRIFSEFEPSVINIPDEIEKVEIIIHNIAEGFYPAMHKLTPECCSVSLGEIAPINKRVDFPLHRLMPVVEMTAHSRADTEIKTVTEFIFHYQGGHKVSIDATLPEMQNGDSYKIEIVFEDLRTGIVVDLSDINNWGDGNETDGEILNPM